MPLRIGNRTANTPCHYCANTRVTVVGDCLVCGKPLVAPVAAASLGPSREFANYVFIALFIATPIGIWTGNWGVFIAIIVVLPLLMRYHKPPPPIPDAERFAVAEFTPTQWYWATTPGVGIAIDDESARICIADAESARLLAPEDIAEIAIAQDGNHIITTNRASQLGGTLVGGALLGGVGALIGGLSGSKSSRTMANQLELRITTTDTRRPLHVIPFLHKSMLKSDQRYKAALERIDHWQAVLTATIRKADNAKRASAAPA